MSSAIATRLLWKEYRTQRNLWVMLAFGTFALQFSIWLLVRPPLDDLLPMFLGFAVPLSLLFAVASSAMTFALEREEGTHLRLVTLSCPAGLSLGIKYLVGVLGTALLLVVAVLTSASLSIGLSRIPEALGEVPNRTLLFAISNLCLTIVGAPLIGMFFSLLSRKVLSSMLWTAAITVPAVILSMAFLDNQAPGWDRFYPTGFVVFMTLAVLLLAVVGLVDWLLVRWWMSRGFSDAPTTRRRALLSRIRLQRDGADGGVIVEIGTADREAFNVLTPEQASVLPAPGSGLRWLHSGTLRSRSRTLRFLLWKEMADSRRMYVIASFIAVLGSMLFTVPMGQESDFACFMCYALPIAFGFMAFRGEQTYESFRLLSHRGISPGALWLSKHIVWGLRTVISVVLVLAVSSFVSGGFNNWDESLSRTMRELVGFKGPSLSINVAQSPFIALGRFVTGVTLLYAIGQFASLICRRTSTAFFAAFITYIAVVFWIGVGISFDVPLVCTGLPLIPALFLLTRFRTRSWLVEDDRFKRWLSSSAAGLAGVFVSVCLVWLCRVYSIPVHEPVMGNYVKSDGTLGTALNGVSDEWRQRTTAPVTADESSTAAQYQKAGSRIGNVLRSESVALSRTGSWLDLSEQARDHVLKMDDVIASVREIANRDACAFPTSPTVPRPSVHPGFQSIERCLQLLLTKARHLESTDEVDQALDLYRECLSIARHAAGRGSFRLQYACYRFTDMTTNALLGWAAHPDVDDELIEQAAKTLNDHRNSMLPLSAVNLREYELVREFLAYNIGDILDSRDENPNQAIAYVLATSYPGTSRRNQRIIDWYESASAEVISTYVRGVEKQPKTSIAAWVARIQDSSPESWGTAPPFRVWKSKWLASSPPLNLILHPESGRLVYEDLDCECDIRGTLLAMKLLKSHGESGGYSEKLDGLDDNLNNPWTTASFEWYPKGVPHGITHRSTTIPADTPFLFGGRSVDQKIEAYEHMFEWPKELPPDWPEDKKLPPDAVRIEVQEPHAGAQPGLAPFHQMSPEGMGSGMAGAMGVARPEFDWYGQTRYRFAIEGTDVGWIWVMPKTNSDDAAAATSP